MITVLKNGNLNSIGANYISLYNLSTIVYLSFPVPEKVWLFMQFIQCAVTGVIYLCPRRAINILFDIQTSLFSCQKTLRSLDLPNNVCDSAVELNLSVNTLRIIDHWPRMMNFNVGTDNFDHQFEWTFPRGKARTLKTGGARWTPW